MIRAIFLVVTFLLFYTIKCEIVLLDDCSFQLNNVYQAGISGVTLEKCENICKLKNECTHFTFTPENNVCSLKRTETLPKLLQTFAFHEQGKCGIFLERLPIVSPVATGQNCILPIGKSLREIRNAIFTRKSSFTLEKCIEQCRQERNCSHFDYHGWGCFLKMSNASIESILKSMKYQKNSECGILFEHDKHVEITTMNSKQPKSSSNGFIVLMKNIGFSGNNVRCEKTHLLTCLEACQNLSLCTHFTVDPFSQQCCLKKSHNIRETQIIVQQAISGFIPLKVDQLSRIDDSSEYDEDYILIYSNAGFAGNELLPNVNDISFQNCLDLCYEQPMCTHFSYYNKNSQCSLKIARTRSDLQNLTSKSYQSISGSMPWKLSAIEKWSIYKKKVISKLGKVTEQKSHEPVKNHDHRSTFGKDNQQTMGVIIQSKSTIHKNLIMDGGIVVSTTKMHDSTNVGHMSQTCHSLKDITVDQSSLGKVSSTGQSMRELLEKYPTIEHTTVKLQKDEELEEHHGMSSTDISSGPVADSIFVYSEPVESKSTIPKSLIMDGGIVVSTTKMHDSTNVGHMSQTCHSLKDITVDQSSLGKVSSTGQSMRELLEKYPTIEHTTVKLQKDEELEEHHGTSSTDILSNGPVADSIFVYSEPVQWTSLTNTVPNSEGTKTTGQTTAELDTKNQGTTTEYAKQKSIIIELETETIDTTTPSIEHYSNNNISQGINTLYGDNFPIISPSYENQVTGYEPTNASLPFSHLTNSHETSNAKGEDVTNDERMETTAESNSRMKNLAGTNNVQQRTGKDYIDTTYADNGQWGNDQMVQLDD